MRRVGAPGPSHQESKQVMLLLAQVGINVPGGHSEVLGQKALHC